MYRGLLTGMMIFIAVALQAQSSECISGDCENGFGVYIWGANSDWAGDKYEGYWKNGLRNGKGTYSYANGSKYVGNTVDNKRNGYGVFTWANGDKYEGNWKDGMKDGEGKYIFADGTVKTGTWKKDEYQISNDQVQKSEMEVLSGCVSGDCSNGFGTYVFESGEKYVGNWKNDMREGKGTNYWVSGAVYVGEWKEDRKHGLGSYTYKPESTLEKYEGYYVNGHMEGKGTLTYRDGKKYVGEFHNDLYSGTGTFTDASGKKKSGKWKCDYFLGTGQSSLIVNDISSGTINSTQDKNYIKVRSEADPCYAAFGFNSKDIQLRARLLGRSGNLLGDFDLKESASIKLSGGGDFTFEIYCSEGAGEWEVVFLTEEQYNEN